MARRQGDIYARIMVKLLTHPRAWAAGIDGMGLFAFCLMFARVNGTNGECTRSAVVTAWGTPAAVGEAILAKLASPACGLVEIRGDLVVVPHYGDHNELPEEIDRRRADAARRKADFLDRKRQDRAGTRSERVPVDPERVPNAFGSVSVSVSVSDLSLSDCEIPPQDGSTATAALPPEPPSGVRDALVLGRDGEHGAAWQAWRDGIRRHTGKPVSDLDVLEQRDLVAFTNAHAGGLRGEPLMTWIASTAAAFAAAQTPGYGLTPRRCKAWLDEGRPARASPRGPLIQGATNTTRLWKTGEEA